MLPQKDRRIDVDFMEKFINTIKKVTIKDVVLYADKQISETNGIINKK